MKKGLLFLILIFASLNFTAQSTFRSEEAAIQLADSIYKKLAEGQSFKKLAIKYSEDPGSNQTGKYSNCRFGTFTPEFEEVVLLLKQFEISKPFKTIYGYHIVQLINKTADTFDVGHILIKYSE